MIYRGWDMQYISRRQHRRKSIRPTKHDWQATRNGQVLVGGCETEIRWRIDTIEDEAEARYQEKDRRDGLQQDVGLEVPE